MVPPVVARVIGFGGPELGQWHDLGHDGRGVAVRDIHPADSSQDKLLLLRGAVEGDGANHGAGVGALTVELSGVVGAEEKYVEQLLVAYLLGL